MMAVADKILNSTKLPTLPAVAVQLLELSRDSETELAAFVQVIKSDPAISARVVQTANSSFFGLRARANSIERAVTVLGSKTVSALALGFSLVENTRGTGTGAEFYRQYWLQSVVQAIVAETLATNIRNGMESEFFLTGLMLDLGRLAMLKAIPDEYVSLLAGHDPAKIPLNLLEQQELGISHVEIGARMLEKWEFPNQIIDAVAQHHTDTASLVTGKSHHETSLIPAAVFAAAAGEYFCSSAKGSALQQLRELAQRVYQRDELWLEKFLMAAGLRIGECAQLFSADSSRIPECSDLILEANSQLADMAVMAQIAAMGNKRPHENVIEELQALEKRNRELENQAITDPLTGAFNRRFFDETLKKELARCQRYKLSAGILFCDVDHFKLINDNYSHAVGDDVLVNVARVLNDSVRSSDTVARYGGEEFVVLLIDINQGGVARVAERIRNSIEKLELVCRSRPLKITISIGGTVTIPFPGSSENLGKQLIERADEAMYEAKQSGRNRVVFRDFSCVPNDLSGTEQQA